MTPNLALNFAPFSRWTPRDKAAPGRLVTFDLLEKPMPNLAPRYVSYALAPALLGMPGSVLADGDMSGLAVFIVYLVGALTVLWCGVTGFVFWAGRKLPKRQRLALTGFVLVAPLLGLAGDFALESGRNAMHAYRDASVTEPAVQPLTVGGVTFPAGSQVTYRREGFWRRHPVAAVTEEILSLGNLRLRQLEVSEFDANVLRVSLAAPQEIAGWRCSDREPVLLRQNGTGFDLLACKLESSMVAGLTWPDGARLVQTNSGNWQIEWQNSTRSAAADCEEVISVHDFPLNQAIAKYDRERQFLSLSGMTCNKTIPVGRYIIKPWALVEQGPDGVLHFSSNVALRQSGKAVACLQVGREQSAEACDA